MYHAKINGARFERFPSATNPGKFFFMFPPPPRSRPYMSNTAVPHTNTNTSHDGITSAVLVSSWHKFRPNIIPTCIHIAFLSCLTSTSIALAVSNCIDTCTVPHTNVPLGYSWAHERSGCVPHLGLGKKTNPLGVDRGLSFLRTFLLVSTQQRSGMWSYMGLRGPG